MILATVAFIALTRQQEPPETTSRRLSLIAQSSTNRLEDIAINADETRILTHDRNYAPRLWDRKTMRLLKVLEGHTDYVDAVEFSLDGQWIVSLSANEVIVWDSKFAHKRGEWRPQSDEKATEATFTSDSKRLIVGTDKGRIVLCDLTAKESSATMPLGARVTDVQCALKSQIACAADALGKVHLFDATTLKPLDTWDTGSRVLWARIDWQGEHVVATTIDEKATLFTRGQKTVLAKTFDHYMGTKGGMPLTLMASLFVGKNGDQLLVAEESGLMRLYDVKTLQAVGKLEGHTAQVREIRQSIDGTKVATYGDDEQLKIWDTVAQNELPFTRGPGGPTAGEFSSDGSAFWLGFVDGSLRRHDTRTGAYDSEAVGQTSKAIDAVQGGRWLYFQSYDNRLVDVLNPAESRYLGWDMTDFRFSPNNEYACWQTLFEDERYLYDTQRGKALMRYLNCLGAKFSHDSKYLLTWHKNGDAYVWRTVDGESEKGWTMEKDKPCNDLDVSPVDDLLLTVSQEGGKIEVWNYLTGDVSLSGTTDFKDLKACSFSSDGKQIAAVGPEGVGVWNQPKGDDVMTWRHKFNDEAIYYAVQFAPSGRWLSVIVGNDLFVLDMEDGSPVLEEKGVQLPAEPWSIDGKVCYYDGNAATVFDPSSKTKTVLRLPDFVQGAQFSTDGRRLMTVDLSDGMVVWDLAAAPARLGSFVRMLEGDMTWLVLDDKGRYDASDPANVVGAHYVLEWEGGLEPISVEQLKDQFWEPGLLAKLLGVDPDPPRTVPPLSELRLYPELTVEKGDGVLQIGVEERDDGGAGVLKVWVNGKLVQTRNNPPGFFELDTSAFDRFYLPTNLLPEGQGNLVRVSVTNKRGDLESAPVIVDVGVPEDLKPPEVRLYALFVGVSDYVGTTRDLTAPASDARDLESALKTVAERLLPNRVETTLLTAEQGKPKPDRVQILKWFDDVAKKATASDIVLVFLSGHGVNQIAGEQDYFFLTPEADPSSIGAMTARTAAISGTELGEKLSTIAASKQVVILDTCHSGAFANRNIKTRSVSGDYRRAWQAIRDTTGTWMLAGSAADQLSYESANIGHGMLTYALLEAIDKASAQGLRQSESGELFVDVERWLEYAAVRVDSLKNEIGIAGVQKPQVARSNGSSFDVGAMPDDLRGFIGLKPPRPIVIVGEFDQDKEDPLGLEVSVTTALKNDDSITVWTDVAAHPRAFRIAGSYKTVENRIIAEVYVQVFGQGRERKTLEKFSVEATSANELTKLIAEKTVSLLKTLKLPETGEIKTGGG